MKLLLSALLALSLSMPATKKAEAADISITLAVGVSLSVAVIALTPATNESVIFGLLLSAHYDRSDLYQDAIKAVAINEADAISQNLGAFLQDFRATRADLEAYSDLEILTAMLELEHQ